MSRTHRHDPCGVDAVFHAPRVFAVGVTVALVGAPQRQLWPLDLEWRGVLLEWSRCVWEFREPKREVRRG